jgi:midasin
MKHLIDVACEEPREDLIRFASYQHFIWAHDAGGGGKGTTVSLNMRLNF